MTYIYDADGERIKKVEDGRTTVYPGNSYEKNLATGVVTPYYFAGGQRIAQRQGDTVSYFVGDHLGSTSVTTNAGAEIGRQKYYPFDAPRLPPDATSMRQTLEVRGHSRRLCKRPPGIRAV